MLTHDQKNEQDEVKNEVMEDNASVNEEQVSNQTTETVEAEPQEPEQPVPAPSPEEAQPEPVIETPAPVEEPKPAKPKAPAHTAEKSEMELLLEESESNLKKGQIVQGTVVDITDKEVMVDIGYKSEGVISINEFAYSGIPTKNEVINVFISQMEDGEGKLHLSKKHADFIVNKQLIKEAFEQQKTVSGAIRRRVKGGMIVDVLGIEAFLPGSQMSLKPIPNLDQFIGKEMTFKIVSWDEERRNIILSRKKVLEEEMSSKRNELLSHIEIGSELEGEVKNITQYGAFIDLGGIDGLLHLSDMSWGKINHPADMLNIGDKLKVKVIQYDPENGKISLGLKQLVPHPWEHIEIKYPEGTRVTGKVVSVKSYGAFIEIEPGVEGLVHISEMSWTKKITDARRVLKVNDTVNAIVLELNKENKRISLGMKQMEANPWLTIEDRYPIGTVLTKKVKSLTTFGAFVEIEEGIDGLVHISDISWTKRIYHPKEVYKKNQEVEAIVLSIDRALHRIALGVKQLKADPWENLPTRMPVNTEVKGKVSKLIPKGLLVDVLLDDYIVEGFVPISHLAIPKLEHSEDAFHVGEELPLKVIELDTENRRLIMSVKAFFFSRDPKLQEEYIALHEQYMRDRIARMQKKKAEKEARQRDKQPGEKHVTETPKEEHPVEEHIAAEPVQEEVKAEAPTEIVPEMEVTPEPQPEPVVAETPAEQEAPVAELVAEDIPVIEPEVTEPEVQEETQPEAPLVAEEPVQEETPVAEPVEKPIKKAAPKKTTTAKKEKTTEPKPVKEKKTTKAKTAEKIEKKETKTAAKEKKTTVKKAVKEKKAVAEKKTAKPKKKATE